MIINRHEYSTLLIQHMLSVSDSYIVSAIHPSLLAKIPCRIWCSSISIFGGEKITSNTYGFTTCSTDHWDTGAHLRICRGYQLRNICQRAGLKSLYHYLAVKVAINFDVLVCFGLHCFCSHHTKAWITLIEWNIRCAGGSKIFITGAYSNDGNNMILNRYERETNCIEENTMVGKKAVNNLLHNN